MKKIGITQRVLEDHKTGERKDTLDQAWYDLGKALDILFVPIPNNPEHVKEYAESLGLEGLLLSGGNNIGIQEKNLILGKTLEKDDVAYERDKTELALLEWAIQKKIPVVGVCRGFEFLNVYFGGSLRPLTSHAGTTHELQFLTTETRGVFGNKRMVRSFHDFAIEKGGLAKPFEPFAVAEDGTVEGARHTELPFIGIMWHPEREQDVTTHQDFMRNCFFSKP